MMPIRSLQPSHSLQFNLALLALGASFALLTVIVLGVL